MFTRCNKIIWSAVIYATWAFLLILINRSQKEGVISIAGVLFILDWLIFGILGIIAFFLRKARILRTTQFGYVFLGVANLANAIWGASVLWSNSTGDADMTAVWFQLGATLCISFLILTDIFLY